MTFQKPIDSFKCEAIDGTVYEIVVLEVHDITNPDLWPRKNRVSNCVV